MNRKAILIIGLFITALNLNALEISLEDYLSLVEENSKDLYLAETEEELALNQERLVRSQLLPMVSGEVAYQRNFIEQEQPMAVASTGPGPLYFEDIRINRDNDLSWNVGVQQTIFNMSVFKALQASRQYREMTGTIFEASRQGILTAAKKVYFQTLLLDEVYRVKQFTEQNAYETYLDIQSKYESEIASQLEMLQAEVNWMITKPETTQAARNRDLAMSNLKLMAGIQPEEKVILTETLAQTPEALTDIAFAEILGSRPDYQVMLNEQVLREINISKEISTFYPSIAMTFGYGWQASSDDFAFDEMEGEGMQVGVTVTVPIFLGGSRFTQVQKAKIELAQANTRLEQKQNEISTEIHNLRMLLEESQNRIEVAESTLRTAEKAYEIVELSAQNGLATQLDLKDARLNLEGAKLNFFKANYDFLEAFFSWQQAIGEGDRLP